MTILRFAETMQSILARASETDICGDPFPHLVVYDALPSEYYQKLADQFPDSSIILNGRQPQSNRNFRYAAHAVIDDIRISSMWREFIRYHVSSEFFQEVRNLFSKYILQLNPRIEAQVGRKLENFETSIRFREPPSDVALECQFAYGAPVTKTSRMIGPHVDREVALFAGLFYLRDDEDDSVGGALQLFRWIRGPLFAEDRHYVPDDRVEVFKTIPYEKNTLVMFLHSPDSLHGVSRRSVTKFSRRHVNFVGELKTKVFDVGPFVAQGSADDLLGADS